MALRVTDSQTLFEAEGDSSEVVVLTHREREREREKSTVIIPLIL